MNLNYSKFQTLLWLPLEGPLVEGGRQHRYRLRPPPRCRLRTEFPCSEAISMFTTACKLDEDLGQDLRGQPVRQNTVTHLRATQREVEPLGLRTNEFVWLVDASFPKPSHAIKLQTAEHRSRLIHTSLEHPFRDLVLLNDMNLENMGQHESATVFETPLECSDANISPRHPNHCRHLDPRRSSERRFTQG